MTYTDDCTLPTEMLEQIASQGFDVLLELIRIVINTAMQAERQKYLRAVPFNHSPDRQGHANGYKPKTVKTRVGEITFSIPQVRDSGFYPSTLEKGLRSQGNRILIFEEMDEIIIVPSGCQSFYFDAPFDSAILFEQI